MGDFFAGDDDGEKFPQVHEVEEEVEVGAFGGGAYGARNGRLAQRGEEMADAGEGFDAVLPDEIAVEFLFLVREGIDFGRCGGPAEVGDYDIVFFAEAAFEVVRGKGQAALRGEDFPAAFVMRRGIDDHAVPIENDRAEHQRPASVTAPVEALVVWAANLASTPRR